MISPTQARHRVFPQFSADGAIIPNPARSNTVTQVPGANASLLPQRLRQVRMLRNMSQASLAQAIGAGVRTIGEYESGAAQPPAQRVAAMAQVLSCTTDFLLGLVDHELGLEPGTFVIDLEAIGTHGATWYAKVPRRYRIVDFDELRRIEREGHA